MLQNEVITIPVMNLPLCKELSKVLRVRGRYLTLTPCSLYGSSVLDILENQWWIVFNGSTHLRFTSWASTSSRSNPAMIRWFDWWYTTTTTERLCTVGVVYRFSTNSTICTIADWRYFTCREMKKKAPWLKTNNICETKYYGYVCAMHTSIYLNWE